MIKVLLGVLLMATPALAQTTPQTAKTSAPKSASGSASSAKPTSASASARSKKPIPPPSMKDNLESKDNAIPTYKKEKDAGVQKVRYRYQPRRTESGARKDTLIDRRKSQ
ncbi:hypothetical protein [Spirosoma radiotolerans]|uniref:Uncharacterized protein n=1 Tax=Spirosoma radiotolerans TaxID=1379870 RepID=A0A0E3ZTE0_9BACT|nr:hypothetical protein [Spirosoma radiotolerans]AKD53984.1 hypothetical protein SD10_02735 [Spirosoma radiotolerans]